MAFEQEQEQKTAEVIDERASRTLSWLVELLINGRLDEAVAPFIYKAARFVIPWRPNVHIEFFGRFVSLSDIIDDNRFVLVPVVGRDYVYYENADKHLVELVDALRSDPEGFARRALRWYYNVLRAVVEAAERYRDDSELREAAKAALDALGLVESAYADLFGEMPVADEEVVGKLVALYGKFKEFSKVIEGLAYDISKTMVDGKFLDEVEVGACIGAGGGRTLCADAILSTRGVSVKVTGYTDVPVVVLHHEVNAPTTIDMQTSLLCFECLDDALALADAAIALTRGLVSVASEARRAIEEVIGSKERSYRPVKISIVRSYVKRLEKFMAEKVGELGESIAKAARGLLADAPERRRSAYAVFRRYDTVSKCSIAVSASVSDGEAKASLEATYNSLDYSRVVNVVIDMDVSGDRATVRRVTAEYDQDMTLTDEDLMRFSNAVWNMTMEDIAFGLGLALRIKEAMRRALGG